METDNNDVCVRDAEIQMQKVHFKIAEYITARKSMLADYIARVILISNLNNFTTRLLD